MRSGTDFDLDVGLSTTRQAHHRITPSDRIVSLGSHVLMISFFLIWQPTTSKTILLKRSHYIHSESFPQMLEGHRYARAPLKKRPF
jgi:hypothetical protein